MKVKVNIDVNKIISKRNFNKAQRFFTSEVRRHSDPYTPFDSGPLKNTAKESINTITYVQPYSKRQYYENKGRGTQGTSKGGMRGKLWIPRMWVDRGREITEAVAKFIGGKVK